MILGAYTYSLAIGTLINASINDGSKESILFFKKI